MLKFLSEIGRLQNRVIALTYPSYLLTDFKNSGKGILLFLVILVNSEISTTQKHKVGLDSVVQLTDPC